MLQGAQAEVRARRLPRHRGGYTYGTCCVDRLGSSPSICVFYPLACPRRSIPYPRSPSTPSPYPAPGHSRAIVRPAGLSGWRGVAWRGAQRPRDPSWGPRGPRGPRRGTVGDRRGPPGSPRGEQEIAQQINKRSSGQQEGGLHHRAHCMHCKKKKQPLSCYFFLTLIIPRRSRPSRNKTSVFQFGRVSQ